jgi:hypothetical protein
MDQPPEQQSQPRRLTAAEARKKYGIYALVLLALTIWFGYDGWFNPNIEAKTFNKIGTVLLSLGFLFCCAMTLSAHRAVLREQRQKQSQPPPAG